MFISQQLTKRNVQTMDRLNLTQINHLSEKLLVNMFSDTSADEMRKQYTYTCYLVPDTCHENITVYGNELKARMRMREHLQQHLVQLKHKHEYGMFLSCSLMQNVCSIIMFSFSDESFDFTAEPIHARKKRIAGIYNLLYYLYIL